MLILKFLCPSYLENSNIFVKSVVFVSKILRQISSMIFFFYLTITLIGHFLINIVSTVTSPSKKFTLNELDLDISSIH